MARAENTLRKPSTIIRDNTVHDVYSVLKEELGDLIGVVSRAYIYDRIKEKTGLCHKTIAFILNHTRYSDVE